jgi:preprotein translocase subunit Sss1
VFNCAVGIGIGIGGMIGFILRIEREILPGIADSTT